MGTEVEELNDVDPDDPRPPFQQIANALRAAILMERFSAGDRLPSQSQLTRRYGVARETIRSALQVLDREQLIVSRQGSGAFVRARRGTPMDLQGLLRSAFDRPHVSIDYAGFQGETLSNTLIPCLNEIATGTLDVRSLRLRMLLVDPTATTEFPRPVDGSRRTAALRKTLAGITRAAVTTITDSVTGLTRAGLLTASVEVRVHRLGPMVKIYLLNGEHALLGFYPVTEYAVTVKGEPVSLHHPSGWDTVLFGPSDGKSVSTGPQTSGPPFAEQAHAWFESIWSTIATEYRP